MKYNRGAIYTDLMNMVKDPLERCPWCTSDPLYIDYHDTEWGVPEEDEQALFERLVLEGMQAGLSWFTVLKKRSRMREQFFEFEPERLAQATEVDVESWLQDAGLIRHRGKLEAMVNNARRVMELGGGFPEMLWSFVEGVPVQNAFASLQEVPAETAASRDMAKCLKKEGFSFVGPTTCYAFMQSAGLVNDHLTSCEGFQRCGTIGADWKL
jgi:DNA-3-methyladenine glycosylase I